jgi:thiol:disulfide interchange protein DsbC
MMNKNILNILLLSSSILMLASCGHSASNGQNPEQIKAEIAKAIPSLPKIDSVGKSQVTGLYEVISGGKVYYVTIDGKYLVFGNVVEIRSKKSMTAEREQQINHPAGKK